MLKKIDNERITPVWHIVQYACKGVIFLVQASQYSNMYWLEAIQPFLGQMVAVQQTGNRVQHGILAAICPDYIVLDVCRTPFYIRMEQIVWVTPVVKKG